MRILIIFPIIFTALFSRGTSKASIPAFEKIVISPLYYYGKTTTVEVTTSALFCQYYLVISNDRYENQIVASKTTTGVGKFTFTYDNSYTHATNEIHIEYRYGRKMYSSSSISMSPVEDSYKHIVDNESVVSTGEIYVLDSSLNWSHHKVTYNFTNFDGLYMPDYYHKIRLDEFEINMDSQDKVFFDCEPSLVIKNVNGVFNDVANAASVEFPLKLLKTDTGFTFELKDIIYVNKETLFLSKTEKDGYVATKHIYLPRNDMQNQDKYTCFFAFQNFGVDKCFVRHNFELRALKNIIGDCQNSEYCIQRTEI